MKRFIVLTFAFLGLAFYELSGGGGFDPDQAREMAIQARLERQSSRQSEIAAWQPPKIAVAENGAPRAEARAEVTEVTRIGLDLVSFTAATQKPQAAPDQEAVETVSVLPRAPRGERVPLSELAGLSATAAAPISIDALETETNPQQDNAFPGSRQIASSADITDTAPDIRSVKGTLVNMRSGPGTDYDVVDQLEQATEVEVLTDAGNGWVELRPLDGGTTGWIAEFLLTGS